VFKNKLNFYLVVFLRFVFSSVAKSSGSTKCYGFRESDVTSIVKKQKEEKLFPIVLEILQPQLGRDVVKLILNMI